VIVLVSFPLVPVIVTVDVPATAVAPAVNVTTSVAVPAIVVVAREAVTPDGTPEITSEAVDAKPLAPTSEIVLFPVDPSLTLTVVGDAVSEKLGAGETVTDAVPFTPTVVPVAAVAAAVIVNGPPAVVDVNSPATAIVPPPDVVQVMAG
jgi:hypothetical protein